MLCSRLKRKATMFFMTRSYVHPSAICHKSELLHSKFLSCMMYRHCLSICFWFMTPVRHNWVTWSKGISTGTSQLKEKLFKSWRSSGENSKHWSVCWWGKAKQVHRYNIRQHRYREEHLAVEFICSAPLWGCTLVHCICFTALKFKGTKSNKGVPGLLHH